MRKETGLSAPTCYSVVMPAASTDSTSAAQHARRFWISMIVAIPLAIVPLVWHFHNDNFVLTEAVACFVLVYGLLQTRAARDRGLDEITRAFLGSVFALGFVAFLDHQLYMVHSGQAESTTTFAPIAALYKLFGFWVAAGVLTLFGMALVVSIIRRMGMSRGWWGNAPKSSTQLGRESSPATFRRRL